MVITLGVCAFLSAVCSLISLSKKEKMSSLKEKLRNAELINENSNSAIRAGEASLKDTCKELLKDLAKELKFEKTDRITLYLYDEKVRSFRPIARVSSNTQIEEPGDLIHSCDKGCLGDAWRDGHAKCSAPSKVTTRAGKLREEEWVKWCCTMGFTEKEARKIGFKALEYFGWRVQHGHFEKKLAILMLESSQRERWNAKELLVRLNSDVKRWSDLLKLVNRFTSLIPDKEVARRRQM